jgi:hypothetical protein
MIGLLTDAASIVLAARPFNWIGDRKLATRQLGSSMMGSHLTILPSILQSGAKDDVCLR